MLKMENKVIKLYKKASEEIRNNKMDKMTS